jgi:Flp pilus assembly protein TadG
MITHAKSSQLHSKSWKGSKGAELVEMALILQVLFMLLIGMFWAGRACHIYGTITRAAREGARAAIAPSCGTCDSGTSGSDNVAIHNAVDRVLDSNSIAASVDVRQHLTVEELRELITNQHHSLNVDAVNWVNLDPVNSNAKWTVISITSPFHLDLPYINIRPINISTHVQMLEEQ